MYPDTTSGSTAGGRFNTTRWSLIISSLKSDAPDGKAREALAQLCRIYWRPIFAFICRQDYSIEDAQDITQDFFVMILKGDLIQRADRSRGRFRTLLLRSLQNFLIDAHKKTLTRKRGGDRQIVSWDDWMAEAPSRLSISASELGGWPPEKIFDVRWAATVAEDALRQLQEECEKHGRRRVFDALSGLLTANREDVSYATVGRELGLELATVKRVLRQMRQRYRQLLRAQVAQTVERPEEVDDELRYLVSVLATK
ncbi:MAG TPA: ECF-type sigma factor [Chthoniobacterales bacterium]|jgi:RNA polymerase sigma-70 factor (ECF subfamily)